jgi:hypothetical protein
MNGNGQETDAIIGTKTDDRDESDTPQEVSLDFNRLHNYTVTNGNYLIR